ncbi:MAG: recombinase family protein [Oscillospiraceae bacterium]|jgi:DNA invertase Pin-like site-specific DNA recombinase|nr:recombinase family protein [Oscillospiraceae bacterium]
MNAIIYARYSSENQTEQSIEGQLRECKAFAEKNGMAVISTYIDRALSAKTDNRPEFQKLVKDSAKGLFDIVLVWKLDRFARNRYDSAHYKAILKKNGVKVVSATESIAEDSTGILLESLLEGYAEFYSVELSEKVRRGHMENALKCKWNGGGRPVGYVVDESRHLQIDPLTAPFVVDAFHKYADGETIVGIVKWLNSQGVLTYRNKPMSIDSVNRLLKCRTYLGEYRYAGIVTPGGVPAIFEQELFDKVQARLEKNKKAPARHKAEDEYLLTTKLFCGHCGAYLVGESGTSTTKFVHHYYKCVSAKKHRGCKKKTVKKNWIENVIIRETMDFLNDDITINRLVRELADLQKRENTALPLLRKELADTERNIENMLDAIQQGVLTSSTKTRLEKLEAAKSDIEVRILQEEMQKPLLSEDEILFWLHKFRRLDVSTREHRQLLIDSFVNAIYLYDDKIVLTFNYKDGTKTLNISEITKSFSSDLTASGGPASREPCNHCGCGVLSLFHRREPPLFSSQNIRV